MSCTNGLQMRLVILDGKMDGILPTHRAMTDEDITVRWLHQLQQVQLHLFKLFYSLVLRLWQKVGKPGNEATVYCNNCLLLCHKCYSIRKINDLCLVNWPCCNKLFVSNCMSVIGSCKLLNPAYYYEWEDKSFGPMGSEPFLLLVQGVDLRTHGGAIACSVPIVNLLMAVALTVLGTAFSLSQYKGCFSWCFSP